MKSSSVKGSINFFSVRVDHVERREGTRSPVPVKIGRGTQVRLAGLCAIHLGQFAVTLDNSYYWTNPLCGKSKRAALRFVRAIANRAVFAASCQPADGVQRHCQKTNHRQRDSIRFNAHKAIPLPNLRAQSNTFLAHRRGDQPCRSTRTIRRRAADL